MFYASPEHEGLVIVGLSVVFCAFCCAVVYHASTETRVPSARPQRLFELLAACAKLVLTFVGVAWEARLGKEPVQSARAGVVFWAYAHDATLAGVSLALLAAHVATQSVRGDAAGWNQWRAGTYAACAWVGALSLAAKVVGGQLAALYAGGECIDSGASRHMTDLSAEDPVCVGRRRRTGPLDLRTVLGTKRVEAATPVFVGALKRAVEKLDIPGGPKVLSMGQLIEDDAFSLAWSMGNFDFRDASGVRLDVAIEE